MGEALAFTGGLFGFFALGFALVAQFAIVGCLIRLLFRQHCLQSVELDHAAAHQLVIAAREVGHLTLCGGQFELEFGHILR